ncbi:right-handed parallel beta-helix repeat-containing protein, partial [Bacteroidia bacterium]|nr:right-handed parallel beta-helix repeat-containing protein [Bacteroidia bacterium]
MKNKYILFTLSFCFIVYNSQATTYYVKTGGNNSSAGTSWSTAKADLQYAINLAVNTGDEVWIAAGTYKPTHLPSTGGTSTSSRDLSFYLDEDIKIYGGFAGTETALS